MTSEASCWEITPSAEHLPRAEIVVDSAFAALALDFHCLCSHHTGWPMHPASLCPRSSWLLWRLQRCHQATNEYWYAREIWYEPFLTECFLFLYHMPCSAMNFHHDHARCANHQLQYRYKIMFSWNRKEAPARRMPRPDPAIRTSACVSVRRVESADRASVDMATLFEDFLRPSCVKDS